MDHPSSPSEPSARNSPNPSASTANLTHRPASQRQRTDSSSASRNNQNSGNTPIPDEDHGGDMPMTMSASVVLTSLPRDAHQALADAEAVDTGKSRCIPVAMLK